MPPIVANILITADQIEKHCLHQVLYDVNARVARSCILDITTTTRKPGLLNMYLATTAHWVRLHVMPLLNVNTAVLNVLVLNVVLLLSHLT